MPQPKKIVCGVNLDKLAECSPVHGLAANASTILSEFTRAQPYAEAYSDG